MMKYYKKMLELGCFSRSDLTAVTGNDATAASIIRAYLKKGYIERVRHDLYAAISLETGQPVLTAYQIGCRLFPDACLSHHTAFEVYGCANQVFYEIYISTRSRFEDFWYNGMHYRRVAAKKEMDTVEMEGLRVTSVEQTVIDSIADMEKIAGPEEIIRCILMLPTLDDRKLLEILEYRDNGFLYQKCGYILEQLNEEFHLPDSFFKECSSHIAGSKRPLAKEFKGQPWNRKWGIYAPKQIVHPVEQSITN